MDRFDREVIRITYKVVSDINSAVRDLTRKVNHIMATVAELQAAVDNVAAVQKTESDNAAKVATDILAAIEAIKTLGIPASDLDPIVAQLQGLAGNAQTTADNLASSASSLEAALPPKT